MRDLFFFYAASAIGDRDETAVFFVRKTDLYPFPVTVLDRIFEDVLEDLLEAGRISG